MANGAGAYVRNRQSRSPLDVAGQRLTPADLGLLGPGADAADSSSSSCSPLKVRRGCVGVGSDRWRLPVLCLVSVRA